MVRSVVVAVGLLALAGLAGYLVGDRLQAPEPVPVQLTGPGEADGTITVHVSGAVASPGLVEVDAGGRLADAIAAAGGATTEAELSGVNLAETLVDGTQVVIPTVGADGRGGGSDGRIRLNAADASELEALPGIGPVLAQRIVDHRERAGPFEEVEDLLDVSGIGERLLAGLADLVVP